MFPTVTPLTTLLGEGRAPVSTQCEEPVTSNSVEDRRMVGAKGSFWGSVPPVTRYTFRTVRRWTLQYFTPGTTHSVSLVYIQAACVPVAPRQQIRKPLPGTREAVALHPPMLRE